MRWRLALSLALLAGALASPALADDWQAVKLRGQVFELVDGQWLRLERNHIISDSRVIRTAGNGHVVLQRDAETITLSPNTQIQIFDAEGRRYTTVQQQSGAITVEAEVQNVEHFAVQTQFMAAVVKGTRFTVTVDDDGGEVKVQRGRVAVEDRSDRSHVTVGAGQSAAVKRGKGEDTELTVAGKGELPEVLTADEAPPPSAADVKLLKELAKAEAKEAEEAEKLAERLAKEAAKAEQEAAKGADKAADAAAKAAQKAAKDAAKVAERAAREAAKAAEKARKAAQKALKG